MFPTVVPVHAVCHELISDIYVKTDLQSLMQKKSSKPKSILVIRTSHDFDEVGKRSSRMMRLLGDLPTLQKKAEEQTGGKLSEIDILPAIAA